MKKSNYYFRESCRMCSGQSLRNVMKLTPTPPGNDLLTKDELGMDEQVYPLDLYFCEDCYHLQLGHVVDPRILFQKNYTYVSSISDQFVKHLSTYASDMIQRFKIMPGSQVCDIGSNDGTCLKFFKDKGMKVIGVDPAKEIALRATKAGIETVGDFFGYDLAIKLREKYGPVKFITSHNACAHIDNLLDVVKGVEYWLDKDGIFVFEVGYLVDVYCNTFFDTIYHEHVDYHTVAPFEKFFRQVNMEVFSAQRISPQGGSIRLMTQKKGGKFQRDSSVDKLISLERELGFFKAETFHQFNEKISLLRDELASKLRSLKAEGKTIAGFGAPTKATTFMGHFGLDGTVLDFIVDDNPLKQGLYTPISHVPVISTDALYERKPNFVLILAWNFANSIMRNHKKYGKEVGQFILPMPSPRIV